jgi:cation diffusion facilitator family transporter
MGDTHTLYRQARRAASWGIALSLGLGLVKFLGGSFGHSYALQTDAIHSLLDALISGTLFGALIFAERPADREHPYGHTRAEALAGSYVALLLMILALAIGWDALIGMDQPHPEPEGFTVLIAVAGALFQEGFYRYASAIARRTGSGALMASAWDYRLDALGSLAVVVGVSLTRWAGPAWWWADHVAAVALALLILWVVGNLFFNNVQELMDRQAAPELLQHVRREAMNVPGVRGVEKLRVRKAGLEYLVDIHVEVDPEQTVREGHSIAHAVKDRVIGGIITIRDVLVHIEPSPDVEASRPLMADRKSRR